MVGSFSLLGAILTADIGRAKALASQRPKARSR